MNTLKKKVVWSAVLLVTHALCFVVGAVVARNIAMNYFFDEAEKADAHVLLGHYTGYRDIAVDIREGKSVEAKCLAELSASAMLDSLKFCLADSGCKGEIKQKIRESAPEILGEAPMPFVYVSSKNGKKICADDALDPKPSQSPDN